VTFESIETVLTGLHHRPMKTTILTYLLSYLLSLLLT